MIINWLGQGGFVFISEGYRLVIDPYLSNSCAKVGGTRMIAPPMDAKGLQPDAIFFTHDHRDHFDEETVLPVCEMYQDCKLIGPKSVIAHIKKIGLKNPIVEVAVGDEIAVGPFYLKVLPAFHSDPYSVGALIEVNGKSIYLSGDSLLDPALLPALKKVCPDELDVVLICINGRLKNMPWWDACKVVETLSPQLAIPMHYGMFYENTVDPLPFIEHCRKAGYKSSELKVGQPTEIESLMN